MLQAAIGWTNSHRSEIRARDVGRSLPNPDFGDGWEHSIRIERISEAMSEMTAPVLVEAAGRCPPEDVGGPWGYRELLDAITNPDHEEHAEQLQWVGGHLDPTDAELPRLAKAVETLARKWTRKPSAKRTRSI